MKALLGLTAAALVVLSACRPAAAPATPPADRCGESKTIVDIGAGRDPGDSVAEYPVRVDPTMRREIRLEGAPAVGADPLMLEGRTLLSHARDPVLSDFGARDCELGSLTDVPVVPLPATWHEVAAFHDLFRLDGGGWVAVFGVETGVHAEQRSRRSPGSYFAVLHRQGAGARLLGFPFADEVVRLSSGTIVVGQPGGRRVEHHGVDEARGLVEGRYRSRLRGSVSIGPDGAVAPFPSRFRDLTGWGADRVWALSAGRRRVVAMDPRGAVVFSRYIGAAVVGLLPFQDGVWVRLRDKSRSYGLDGRQTGEVKHSWDARLAVDAEGLLYVATKEALVAYERDGREWWRERLGAREVSNLVLSPEFGLCLAVVGRATEMICYGSTTTDAMR